MKTYLTVNVLTTLTAVLYYAAAEAGVFAGVPLEVIHLPVAVTWALTLVLLGTEPGLKAFLRGAGWQRLAVLAPFAALPPLFWYPVLADGVGCLGPSGRWWWLHAVKTAVISLAWTGGLRWAVRTSLSVNAPGPSPVLRTVLTLLGGYLSAAAAFALADVPWSWTPEGEWLAAVAEARAPAPGGPPSPLALLPVAGGVAGWFLGLRWVKQSKAAPRVGAGGGTALGLVLAILLFHFWPVVLLVGALGLTLFLAWKWGPSFARTFEERQRQETEEERARERADQEEERRRRQAEDEAARRKAFERRLKQVELDVRVHHLRLKAELASLHVDAEPPLAEFRARYAPSRVRDFDAALEDARREAREMCDDLDKLHVVARVEKCYREVPQPVRDRFFREGDWRDYRETHLSRDLPLAYVREAGERLLQRLESLRLPEQPPPRPEALQPSAEASLDAAIGHELALIPKRFADLPEHEHHALAVEVIDHLVEKHLKHLPQHERERVKREKVSWALARTPKGEAS